MAYEPVRNKRGYERWNQGMYAQACIHPRVALNLGNLTGGGPDVSEFHTRELASLAAILTFPRHIIKSHTTDFTLLHERPPERWSSYTPAPASQ